MNDVETPLSALGQLEEQQIPLIEAALQISSLRQPQLNLDRYRQHLKILQNVVSQRFFDLINAGAQDDGKTRIAALKHIIIDQHGYSGDKDNYDDLQNADLVRVIERRKGLPIALAIITIQVAKAQSWQVEGLNFPAHFLLRLDHENQRLIFDPFNQFQILEAPDLRALLKKVAGDSAELSASFYERASNRDIIIRLQNNIKYRQIEQEEYAEALKTVEIMRSIAPLEHRLLFDAGVLYARVGRLQTAILTLEEYIRHAPNQRDRYDAQIFLQSLRDNLN